MSWLWLVFGFVLAVGVAWSLGHAHGQWRLTAYPDEEGVSGAHCVGGQFYYVLPEGYWMDTLAELRRLRHPVRRSHAGLTRDLDLSGYTEPPNLGWVRFADAAPPHLEPATFGWTTEACKARERVVRQVGTDRWLRPKP
jgi:hypothetical protein